MSIAPLPDDARMDAYYYGFERTGVGFIDAILSAVAIAGKGAHHTESWGDPWEGTEYYFRGRPGLPDADNAVDLIQKAAQQAADAVLALLSQPTSTAEHDEDCFAGEWNEAAGVTCVCTCGVEPPRPEDMAPGTTFDSAGDTFTVMDSFGDRWLQKDDGDAWDIEDIDPSTIRDVTPPPTT
ncbi:hypothetical protein [Curtobacterium sp. 'Ferrero']|uniref:hypothetical protein n=1 Tax=Curtobacterium sp. 'Ferrero' TaxID=2033654 RepID=UPI001596FB71|nr:hypothetical protein [Curtobacterium sp. 'Ferrero']